MLLTVTNTNKDPAFTAFNAPSGLFFMGDGVPLVCVFSECKVSNGNIKGPVSSHPKRVHIKPTSSHRPITSSQSNHILILHTVYICVTPLPGDMCHRDSWSVFVHKTLFQRHIYQTILGKCCAFN